MKNFERAFAERPEVFDAWLQLNGAINLAAGQTVGSDPAGVKGASGSAVACSRSRSTSASEGLAPTSSRFCRPQPEQVTMGVAYDGRPGSGAQPDWPFDPAGI